MDILFAGNTAAVSEGFYNAMEKEYRCIVLNGSYTKDKLKKKNILFFKSENDEDTVPAVWLGRSVCRASRSRPYMEVALRDMLRRVPMWKPTASFSAKISMVQVSVPYLPETIPMAIIMISVL